MGTDELMSQEDHWTYYLTHSLNACYISKDHPIDFVAENTFRKMKSVDDILPISIPNLGKNGANGATKSWTSTDFVTDEEVPSTFNTDYFAITFTGNGLLYGSSWDGNEIVGNDLGDEDRISNVLFKKTIDAKVNVLITPSIILFSAKFTERSITHLTDHNNNGSLISADGKSYRINGSEPQELAGIYKTLEPIFAAYGYVNLNVICEPLIINATKVNTDKTVPISLSAMAETNGGINIKIDMNKIIQGRLVENNGLCYNTLIIPDGGRISGFNKPTLNGAYMGISGSNFTIDETILVPATEPTE